MSTVNHIGLNCLHIVAGHRLYRSSYSSRGSSRIGCEHNSTVRWASEKAPIHSLITQQAAVNLAMLLSSLSAARTEIYHHHRCCSPASPFTLPPLFSHLCLSFRFHYLSFFSFLLLIHVFYLSGLPIPCSRVTEVTQK